MPSLPTHLVVAVALGQGAATESREDWRFWLAALGCSALPDLDVVGFHFGVRYGDLWGHRGLTHSLLAAAILGAAVGLLLGKNSRQRVFLSFLLTVVAASHGLLDAMTNGGLGVALFAPFDSHRYFLPWRPIEVSPIAVGRFASGGIAILGNEAKFVWLPALIVGLLLYLIRAGTENGRQGQDPEGSELGRFID
jgi:inner membrane protein